MRHHLLRPLVLLLFVLVPLFTGCKSAIIHHAKQKSKITDAWRQGQVANAAEELTKKAAKHKEDRDAVIWRLEQATALRATGQIKESNDALAAAEKMIDSYDQKAKIDVAEQTVGFVVNQATLPYRGRDYDRVLLNTYRALNFMQMGDLPAARVELTRAYQRQQDAVEDNKNRISRTEADAEKELEKSKNKAAAKELVEKAKADPKFSQDLQGLNPALDGLKSYSDYVNPFTVYLEGLFFVAAAEGPSDLERSRKSLERALAFTDGNEFIKRDLEMVDNLISGQPLPPITYVILETGMAPAREQFKIRVPLFIAGVREVPYVAAAFPVSKKQDGNIPSLNISSGGSNIVTTTLASMDSVVGHAFNNELPTIITKTLINTAVKAVATGVINEAMKKQGAWEKFVVKVLLAILQELTAVADTRTWCTLPKEYQIARFQTPTDGKLELSAPDGSLKTEVQLQPATINIVYVKGVNSVNALTVSQIKLK